MKINGRIFKQPFKDCLVLPREDEPVIFWAKAVVSFKEFNAMCPAPTPPKIMRPGGSVETRFDDPNFTKSFEEHNTRRNDWFYLESLKATPGLEWETIKENEPSTWANWKQELLEQFFTESEINRIQALIHSVNSLNDDSLEEAKASFLASQAKQ